MIDRRLKALELQFTYWQTQVLMLAGLVSLTPEGDERDEQIMGMNHAREQMRLIMTEYRETVLSAEAASFARVAGN